MDNFIPIVEPNPEWRWWKPWLPRERFTRQAEDYLNSDEPLFVSKVANDEMVQFGHICLMLGPVECHIDITGETEPESFSEMCDVAREALHAALTEITKQVEGDRT